MTFVPDQRADSSVGNCAHFSTGPHCTYLLTQTPFLQIPEPTNQTTNQPLHNSYVYSIWNYGRNDLHVLHTSFDAPPTKQQCSHGADLLTLSKYLINKHLTGVQVQATSHCWCVNMNAQCVLPGTCYSM